MAELLLHPANLNEEAQEALLSQVKTVFTSNDNKMMIKDPTTEEVKESVWSANLNAAPGNDGIINLVYKHCWEILGDSLTEVAKAIYRGAKPTLTQRTSLMVY